MYYPETSIVAIPHSTSNRLQLPGLPESRPNHRPNLRDLHYAPWFKMRAKQATKNITYLAMAVASWDDMLICMIFFKQTVTSRWWFQIFFIFDPYLGKIPILTSIFFKWVVQPPTSKSSDAPKWDWNISYLANG